MSPEQFGEIPGMLDDLISMTSNGEIAKLIELLRNVISRLLKKIDSLEKDILKLNETIKTLQTRLEVLESLERDILVGQIALKLEKVLIDHILDGTEVNKECMTIDLLDEAVEYGDKLRRCRGIFLSDNERQLAEKNWNALERQLNLKSVHYNAIKNLKYIRNTKAHPLKPIEEVQATLENQADLGEQSDFKRTTVFELLEMLKKMNVKNIGTLK